MGMSRYFCDLVKVFNAKTKPSALTFRDFCRGDIFLTVRPILTEVSKSIASNGEQTVVTF